MKVIVGCPVVRREWIIRDWLTAAAFSADAFGADVSFMLAGDRADPTMAEAADAAGHLGVDLEVVPIAEPRTVDKRDWRAERYLRMAAVRNQLLAQVRVRRPSLFWSIDSDILAAPAAFSSMATEIAVGADAVAGCCFLSYSTNNPNYACRNRLGRLERRYQPGLVRRDVDIIMANKLMTPQAYKIDYQYHRDGEDFGWSDAARAAGHRLVWVAAPVSKHVMNPQLHGRVDNRCGY